MSKRLTEMAQASAERYATFTNILRSQVDVAFSRLGFDNNIEEVIRSLKAVSNGAARAFLQEENSILFEDGMEVIDGIVEDPSEEILSFHELAIEATWEALSAQTSRDVSTAVQYVQSIANRVEIYMRSTGFERLAAIGSIMREEKISPSFMFLDRAGRKFKSSKHIRDVYRLHLINLRNEVFLHTVAGEGFDQVQVTHPDPNYKWAGKLLSIGPGAAPETSYYALREEIFHPSTDAELVRPDQGA